MRCGVVVAAAVFLLGIGEERAQAQGQGLVLDRNWNTKFQGGQLTMSDIVRLIGTLVQPKVDLGPSDIEIYPGVTYMMPFKQAVKALGLEGNLPSKYLVGCPGFPRESFFYYNFKGMFVDGFTQMYVVVDRADQVVCIQLVQEAPKPGEFSVSSSDDRGWLTYNFVSYRNKAMTKLRINHRVSYYSTGEYSTGWHRVYSSSSSAPSEPFKIIQINTVLFDPEYRGRDGREEKLLEVVRWYLPVPLAGLILHCIGNSMNNRS